MHEHVYENPLIARYASREMAALLGRRSGSSAPGGGCGWRWPRPRRELGLPITAEQIAELRAHVDDIDFAAADAYERKLRHDVMAHVHAYGDECPDGPADHPSGRHELLRHRQHRPDPDARRRCRSLRRAGWRR